MLRIDVWPPDTGESHSIHVDTSNALVGRATFADVRIPYPIVSSRHLEVERRDGRWFVRDLGSSNGTDINGVRLMPGEWQRITDGMRLHIVDLALSFVIVDDLGAGLTLAESGSLVRKLVLAAAEIPDGESAFLEVLEGPRAGDRAQLHDDLTHLTVGQGTESLEQLNATLTIGRSGEWFTIEAGADWVNDASVELPVVLRSGDRILSGAAVILFWDPLQGMLDDLEPAHAEEHTEASVESASTTEPPNPSEASSSAPSGPTVTEIPEEAPSPPVSLATDLSREMPPEKVERGLGIVEVALVVFSIAAFGAAIAILWWLFG